MRLSDLVTQLSAHPGPALTWYGRDGARTELGGPVVARWLAKTANLLGTELAGSLFGEFPSPSGAAGEDAEGSPAGIIRVDLGCSWQSLVWTLAAWLSGWTVVGPASISAPGDSLRDEGDATVWVVASLDAAAVEAAEAGVWVLAHDVAPLALGWSGGPLPEGVLDALGELMAQPDGLAVDPGVDWRVDGAEAGDAQRVLVPAGDTAATARQVLAQWAAGRSVVAVDQQIAAGDDQDIKAALQRIARQERARLI